MITWNYIEPIDDDLSISEFEAVYAVTLPEDYKKLVLRCNNGYPSPNTFSMPDGEVNEMSHLYSFNRGDSENMWDFNSSDNLSAGYVAFGCDPFDNQLAFRLSDNAVVFADYDTDELVQIASDFQAFLRLLEAGA